MIRANERIEDPVTTETKMLRIYDGDGDQLMEKRSEDAPDRILLLPDALPSKSPDQKPKIRVMWGQHLLEDLLAGRYRSLVCAVNTEDNHRGIIAQLAKLLPTSQWDERLITAHAAQFGPVGTHVKVLKYDMDAVEVLAILRPKTHDHLTVDDLCHAFKIVAEMVRRNPARRLPSASVSFLGAQANTLHDRNGREPSFETVLRAMSDAGYVGDVYPAPSMWQAAPIGVFARYPFPETLEELRRGGF
jgi:hypothetical protein